MARCATLLLSCLLWPLFACADPGYYVVTAYDNEGLRTVDLRYWTVKLGRQSEVLWPEVGLGWGVNSRWYTELYVSWVATWQTATRVDTFNWQNEIMLTQGQWPFDLALHASFIRPRDAAEGNMLELGPVLQTEVGRLQINANVFFDRPLAPPVPRRTELKYQWQLRWHAQRALQWGVQGFGELGPWDHWLPGHKQSHRAGPALFARLSDSAPQGLQVQAAYLVGSIYGRRGSMFSMRALWAF